MTKREALHRLIDELPEEELLDAAALLRGLEDLRDREAVQEAIRSGDAEPSVSFEEYCRRRGIK